MKCPWCGHNVPLQTNIDPFITGEKPELPVDGDISLCIKCGEWAIFASKAKNGQRKPRPKEWLAIGLDEHCRLARQAWVATKEVLDDQEGR